MTKKEFSLIYQWNDNDYRPDVRFELGMNETGFTMHITIPESNPMREKTEHFSAVCGQLRGMVRELCTGNLRPVL